MTEICNVYMFSRIVQSDKYINIFPSAKREKLGEEHGRENITLKFDPSGSIF